jgi:hypothetical protein
MGVTLDFLELAHSPGVALRAADWLADFCIAKSLVLHPVGTVIDIFGFFLV